MADKLSAIAGSRNKIFKVLHLIDYRLPSLVALLDGRNHNLVYAVDADYLSFRELAVEERDFIEADFRSLLCHPFYAVHHLCRGDGQVNVSAPGRLLRHNLFHLIDASFIGGQRYFSTIKHPLAIHQEQFVSCLDAQNPERMSSLFLRQFCLCCRIWHIEKSNFFHFLLLFLFLLFRKNIRCNYLPFLLLRRSISSRMAEAVS